MRFTTLFISLFINLITYAQPSAFQWKYTLIPDNVWSRINGVSYKQGCPVKRSALRYMQVLHVSTDGSTKTGEIICHESIAQDLIEIFQKLYEARYVIERIELIDNFNASDDKSMEANNTSCFNFRTATGNTKSISKHGYGLAIDINPLYNPYVKGNIVKPKKSSKYAYNRAYRSDIPQKIDRNDLCYKLFIQHGFNWGGAWKSLKDYQHFEKTLQK